LLYDLIAVAHTVSELVYADLTQNQFDALCAFAFSIGLDAFRASDVLKRVNEGAFTQAAFALELWRRAEFEGQRIVIDALVRRRAAEKLLFLTPPGEAWRAVPSAVIRPELDELAPNLAPRDRPAEVVASLEGATVAVARAPGADGVSPGAPESPVTAAAEAVSARLSTLFADEAPTELRAEAAPSANAPAPQTEPPPAPEPVVAEPVQTAEGEEAVRPRILIDDTAPYEFVPVPVQPINGAERDSGLAIVTLVILGLAFFAGGVFWALNGRPPTQPGVFTPLLVGWLAGVAGVGFIAVAVFLVLQRMTRAAERRDRR
jgi:lysozyme